MRGLDPTKMCGHLYGMYCICFIIFARDTKRQATQHGCLPRLLGDGDEGIEIVHGEEINILYWAD